MTSLKDIDVRGEDAKRARAYASHIAKGNTREEKDRALEALSALREAVLHDNHGLTEALEMAERVLWGEE